MIILKKVKIMIALMSLKTQKKKRGKNPHQKKQKINSLVIQLQARAIE